MPVVDDGSMLNLDGINTAFASAYEQLVHEDALKCDKSNVIHDSVPMPTCVILDVNIGYWASLSPIYEWPTVLRRRASFLRSEPEPA